MAGLRYDAFVSHARDPDHPLADSLSVGLRRMGKKWYERRALRVFLDTSSLSAGPGLWDALQRALEQSRFFVLLASEESARSDWVSKELGFWLDRHGTEGLLLVHIAGSIRWDSQAGDFDWNQTTALPPLLRGRFETEPLYISIPRNPRIDERYIAGVAGAIHGVEPQDLIGEDLRQQSRAHRIRLSAAAGLVLTIIGAGVAVHQHRVAVEEGRKANKSTAQAQHEAARADGESRIAKANALAQQSQVALPADHNVALMLALYGVSVSPTVTARASLLRAVERYPQLRATLRLDNPTDRACHLSQSEMVVASTNGLVQVVELASGKVRHTWPEPSSGPLDALASSTSTGLVGAALERALVLWNPREGTVRRNRLDRRVTALSFDPTGRQMFGGLDDGTLMVWEVPSLQLRRQAKVVRGQGILALGVRPDGRALAAGDILGGVALLDARSLTVTKRLTTGMSEPFSVAALDVSADGSSVVAAGLNHLVVWDLDHGKRTSASLAAGDGDITAVVFAGNTGRVWATQGRKLLEVDFDDGSSLELGQHRSDIWVLAADPTRSEYVSVDHGGFLRRWGLNDRPSLATSTTMELDRLSPVRLAVSEQGEQVAIGASDMRFEWGKGWKATRGTVSVWKQPEGTRVGEPIAFADAITAVAFAPQGAHWFAAARDGTIKAWTSGSRATTTKLQGAETALALTVSPDGVHLVAGLESGGLAVLAPSTLVLDRLARTGTGPIVALACATQDAVVGVSARGEVMRLTFRSGQVTTMPSRPDGGTAGEVIAVVADRSCEHIVMAWEDGRLEVRTGPSWEHSALLVAYPRPTGPTGLAMSGDGRELVIGRRNGEISLRTFPENIEVGVLMQGSQRGFYLLPEVIAMASQRPWLVVARAAHSDLLRIPLDTMSWWKQGCRLVAPAWSELPLSPAEQPCRNVREEKGPSLR